MPESRRELTEEGLPQEFDVACCPVHGLHGCRDTCFECGVPVRQVRVRVVPVSSEPGSEQLWRECPDCHYGQVMSVLGLADRGEPGDQPEPCQACNALGFVPARPVVEATDAVRDLVNKQAEDEGLWFMAASASEAYLQQELRRLHTLIESGPARSTQTNHDLERRSTALLKYLLREYGSGLFSRREASEAKDVLTHHLYTTDAQAAWDLRILREHGRVELHARRRMWKLTDVGIARAQANGPDECPGVAGAGNSLLTVRPTRPVVASDEREAIAEAFPDHHVAFDSEEQFGRAFAAGARWASTRVPGEAVEAG